MIDRLPAEMIEIIAARLIKSSLLCFRATSPAYNAAVSRVFAKLFFSPTLLLTFTAVHAKLALEMARLPHVPAYARPLSLTAPSTQVLTHGATSSHQHTDEPTVADLLAFTAAMPKLDSVDVEGGGEPRHEKGSWLPVKTPALLHIPTLLEAMATAPLSDLRSLTIKAAAVSESELKAALTVHRHTLR